MVLVGEDCNYVVRGFQCPRRTLVAQSLGDKGYRLGVFINDKEGIVAGPEKGKLQNKRRH